jgi:hypothetical protein
VNAIGRSPHHHRDADSIKDIGRVVAAEFEVIGRKRSRSARIEIEAGRGLRMMMIRSFTKRYVLEEVSWTVRFLRGGRLRKLEHG